MKLYGPLKPPATLGERITRVRTALDLSLNEIAAAVGVSTPAVWKWENGSSGPRAAGSTRRSFAPDCR